jgi:predicted dehydrogenase
LHAEVAVPLLDAGIHCLVEKPLAPTRTDAIAILEAATRGGAQLCVGHIERFNPAVRQLHDIVDPAEVLAVEAHRMSAVSQRIADVDVVTDLMVHDIDIVLDLVRAPVVDVCARAVGGSGDAGADFVTALVTFESGALAALTASRVTQNQVRTLDVTATERLFTVDYSRQELSIFRQGRIGGVLGEPLEPGRYVLDVGTERVFVRRIEPLAAELAHVVAVVRGHETPLVGGREALDALELVWAIREQISTRFR